jgi:hypothetical protein
LRRRTRGVLEAQLDVLKYRAGLLGNACEQGAAGWCRTLEFYTWLPAGPRGVEQLRSFNPSAKRGQLNKATGVRVPDYPTNDKLVSKMPLAVWSGKAENAQPVVFFAS